MFMSEYDYYNLLRTIVIAGGRVLNTFRGKVKNQPKESDLPADKIRESTLAHTILDDLTQDIALDILASHTTEIAVNAEEKTDTVNKFSKDKKGLCFHLDPLDGTLSYLKGRDDFTIGAAISKNLEFVASAIYFPAKDRLYYAEKGKGIIVEDANQKRYPFEKIQPPQNKYVQKRCDEYVSTLEALGYEKYDSMSAHNTMIQIAQGNVAVQMYHLASPHDFGIPQVIVEEAGGLCTDLDGNPIKYSENFERVPYFLAFSSKEVFEKVIEALSRITK